MLQSALSQHHVSWPAFAGHHTGPYDVPGTASVISAQALGLTGDKDLPALDPFRGIPIVAPGMFMQDVAR